MDRLGAQNDQVDPSAPALSRPWTPRGRPDTSIALGLAVATFAIRWPLRAHHLWSWDGVLYALAVEDYDLNASRPHPPGFPVFVAMARLVNLVVRDAAASLVVLSLLLSVAGVVLLYGFVREVASRRAALVASLGLMLTPVFFFQGLIMLSYVTEVPISIGLAWAVWRVRSRRTTAAALTVAVIWGLALGTRPSLFFSLTPIAAWGFLSPLPRDREAFRRIAAGAGASAVAVLAWLVPLCIDAGFYRWRQLTDLTASTITFSSATWKEGPFNSYAYHWGRITEYFRYDMTTLVALSVLVALGLAARKAQGAWPMPRPILATLLWWTLPWTAFMLVVHAGMWREHEGYILVILPAVYAAFGIVADRTLAACAAQRTWTMRAATIAAAVLALAPMPGMALQARDHAKEWIEPQEEWTAALVGIRATYGPDDTALVVLPATWLWAKWYLPEYRVWTFFEGPSPHGGLATGLLESRYRADEMDFYDALYRWPDLPVHSVPQGIKNIIFVDEDVLRPRLRLDLEGESFTLGDGRLAYQVSAQADVPTIEAYFADETPPPEAGRIQPPLEPVAAPSSGNATTPGVSTNATAAGNP